MGKSILVAATISSPCGQGVLIGGGGVLLDKVFMLYNKKGCWFVCCVIRGCSAGREAVQGAMTCSAGRDVVQGAVTCSAGCDAEL